MGIGCAFNGTGSTHEGEVVAARNVFVNGNSIAVVGDAVLCTDPEHEAQIAAGSSSVLATKANVSMFGAVCTCSATLKAPVSGNVFIGGALTQYLEINKDLAEDDD